MSRTAYLPPNIDKDGKLLGGIFEKRNLIEATVVALLIWGGGNLFLRFLSPLLQYGITLSLLIPGFLLFAIGIRGLSVTEYLSDYRNYRKKRRIYPFRIPTAEKAEPNKRKRVSLQKTFFCKILSFGLIFLLTTSFTSCGTKTSELATAKGEMLSYTMKEIVDQELGGFFVKHKDDTFSPVMNGASGYQGATTEPSSARFLWHTNRNLNLSALVPTVTKQTPLVGIFPDRSDMPSIYTLERYLYQGYTIGCRFDLDEDQTTVYLNTSDVCPESEAEAELGHSDLEDTYEVATFNKKPSFPIQNLDPDLKVLLGLEKNKYYQVGFYVGTQYKRLVVSADTIVLKSSSLIQLKVPFHKTNKGYFEIALPDNLEDGYYYICDAGLFKYKQSPSTNTQKRGGG